VELRELFSECGEVLKVGMRKKDCGFTFAYIYYSTIEEARTAI
jgi:hypothetical protein